MKLSYPTETDSVFTTTNTCLAVVVSHTKNTQSTAGTRAVATANHPQLECVRTVDGEVHVGHALVHHVGVRVLPGVPLPRPTHLTHEGLHQVHA
jgi:signal transduction protein with GAF and PtsI domain